MQVVFNKRTFTPVAYESKKEVDGKTVTSVGFNTTLFEPVKYGIRFGSGVMDVEEMKSIMEQCAESADKVEVEFVQGQTKYGPYMEVYSVKPVKPVSKAV